MYIRTLEAWNLKTEQRIGILKVELYRVSTTKRHYTLCTMKHPDFGHGFITGKTFFSCFKFILHITGIPIPA
jgi:hypothetical protein